MKTRFKFLYILPLIFLTSFMGKKLKAPDQVGKHVFKILKSLDTQSKVNFASNFITITELKELAKNENVVMGEITRNELNAIQKKDWNARYEGYYNEIKRKNEKYEIKWKEIEYSDFVYKIKYNDGIKTCRGHLYFKYNGTPFKIRASSFFNGKEYKLVKIKSLYEHK